MVLSACLVIILTARAPHSWVHATLLLCTIKLSHNPDRCYTTVLIKILTAGTIPICVLGWQVTEREILIAGESGIFTPEDVAFVQSTGCGAILVGESLVKTGDPAAAVKALLS